MQGGSLLSWVHFHDSSTTVIQGSLSPSLSVEELFPTSCGRTCLGTGTFKKTLYPSLVNGCWDLCDCVYLAGSGRLCPIKMTEGDFNWNFFADSRRSWLLHFSNRHVRFLSWSTSQVLSGLNQDDFEYTVSRIQNNRRWKARPRNIHRRFDRSLHWKRRIGTIHQKKENKTDKTMAYIIIISCG